MAKNLFMQKMAIMPLYEKLELTREELGILSLFIRHYSIEDESIDLYCIHCKEHSIFKPSGKGQLHSGYADDSRAFFEKALPWAALHFTCTRDESHIFEMQIITVDESIIKIGQYPSKADLEWPGLNKYSKVIPSKYLSDIKKAVGLSSHGIGAGSFVYLRRVIEYLLNDSYKNALSDGAINPDEYIKSRIVEKIVLLSDYLPSVLVSNKEAYSILSKGVHELEEEECLENFGLLLTTIELILDEILNEKKRIEREALIKSKISTLHSNLKSDKS